MSPINRLFYYLKPIIPRRLQIALRRKIARHKREKYAYVWPIDPNSAVPPEDWQGWPEGKQFALVLSHDVDTRKGYDNVLKLADIEEKIGFRSQFNFVPERYGKIEIDLLDELKRRGFGIGVHGLYHDGKLFSTKEIFEGRAARINTYLEEWGTKGFTAPAMHHITEWMHVMKSTHSTSTFDTDPFEPQPDGASTIFPYWLQGPDKNGGYLELPYTLPQDHLLYVILRETSNDIWKLKLNWIAERGGMVLLNSHPDYMVFEGGRSGLEEYPVDYYTDLLAYVESKYKNQYWHVLAENLAKFWPTSNNTSSALAYQN